MLHLITQVYDDNWNSLKPICHNPINYKIFLLTAWYFSDWPDGDSAAHLHELRAAAAQESAQLRGVRRRGLLLLGGLQRTQIQGG